MNIFKPST